MKKKDESNTEKNKLNLYQKLIEIRKHVDYIQKSSKGYNYSYADDTAILSVIRPVMDDLGVVLEFEMMEPTQINEKFCQVGFIFTWVNAENPSEQIEKKMYLQDVCGDVKKLGGLCTYANRFFLYKYFNVPTSELDPDKHHQQTSGRINVDQLAYIEKEINGNTELRTRMLSWAQAKDFSELRADQFETIKKSIAQAKAAKEEVGE